MKTDSKFGKNNFDRLEAAGLVAGADNGENMKAKTEARVGELKVLATKVKKVQAYLAEIYVLPRERQLRRLKEASLKLRELHAEKLPVGAKRHIEACLNEVTSLREGVFASNARLDQQTLALTASAKAHTELQAMIVAAEHRLEKIVADSSAEHDLDEFYKNAADVIKKHEKESTKVEAIKDKPFLLVRVPVVPVDGSFAAEKLPQLGFKSESLSGYPVIHNQMVLGINPKMLAGHDPQAAAKFAAMSKQLKDSGVDLDHIKKALGKVKDLLADYSKLDPEKADPKYKAKLEAELAAAQQAAEAMIKKGGVDPLEMMRLQALLKRSHNALPEAIKEEADRLRRLLEKKQKIRLRFVSDTPRSFKAGVWFWLMPDRELDQLAKASPSKRVSISRWGFAFN